MNFVSTENLRPSFRELTASTEKRRGGHFLRPHPGAPCDGTPQHAALGSFPATRLSARENAAVQRPGDSSFRGHFYCGTTHGRLFRLTGVQRQP